MNSTITFESFVSQVSEQIKEFYHGEKTVSIENIRKNNSQMRNALIIRDSVNITPTIYLEPFYEQYLNGKPIDIIIMDIIGCYEEHRISEDIDISRLYDFSFIKERVIYRIINHEQNIELLKDCPHVDYLDLSVVFYYLLANSDDMQASTLIHNSHMEAWNTSVDELMHLASENTLKLLPVECQSLQEFISGMIGCSEEVNMDNNSLLIATNKSRSCGASVVLYQDFLATIADTLKSDLFMLPSSIHEVMLLPASDEDPLMLKELVVSVNESTVSHTDFLSDHVYRYSRDTQKLTIAA